MVVMRTAKFFQGEKNLSLVQVQPCRIQFSKISKKQKRVHRKRGSLSAKVRMGFVYVYGESQGQTVERMVCGDDEKNRDERAMDSVQPHGILLSDFAEFQREI